MATAGDISQALFEDLTSYPGLPTDDHKWLAGEVGDLVYEAWASPVDPVPAWVKGIALAVALRVLHNPKGLASWTKSVDDASRTERVSEKEAVRAGLYLTDAERTELLQPAHKVSSPAGSISLKVPWRGTHHHPY